MEIFNIIKSGTGFINPLAPTIQTALTKLIPRTVDELHALAIEQAALQGITPVTVDQISVAQTSIVGAYNKVNQLLGHSNRLSGVDLSGNGTLATITKTMSAAKDINGDSSCSTVIKALGTINKAASIVSDISSTVEKYDDFIRDINNQIDLLPSTLDSFVTRTELQIVSDTQALADAQLTILQKSVADSMTDIFKDPCSGNILSSVMTNKLKQAVSTEANKIRKRL